MTVYAPSKPEIGTEKLGSWNILGLVAFALLLIGCTWWLMPDNSNPKSKDPAKSIKRLFRALKTQDWKEVYALTYMTPEIKQDFPTAESFAATMKTELNKIPNGQEEWQATFGSLTLEAVGRPHFAGGIATVPVTMSIVDEGVVKKTKVEIKMQKQGGLWKMHKDEDSMGMDVFPGMGSGGSR